MEHIIISPGKLKLMLTKSDLDRYELDAESMDSADGVTRRSLRTLLADVKQVSGFDASSDKVFIQLYPSRDGGAEMYITRLTASGRDTHTEAAVKVTGVYKFESLTQMLVACSKISEDLIPQASSAWRTEGACYLITEECFSYSEFAGPQKKGRLGELLGSYSRAIASPAAIAYVREHCECIAERDAVKTLASLA